MDRRGFFVRLFVVPAAVAMPPAAATPPETCAYCGRPAEGNFSIHRDGFGVGPEVPLCDACGSYDTPTEGEIWDRIAQPVADDEFAYRSIRNRS